MIKVVISTLNSQYVHASLAPWYLLAGLKEYCKADFSACVYEGTINQDINTVAQQILDLNPDVIGICCYIWNISDIKKLVALLKAKSEAKIVLGGPEVSYNAKDVLEELKVIEGVISGEGELPFAQFVDAIDKGTSYENIQGFCYKNDGKIIIKEPYIALSDPPKPYCDEFMGSINGRIAYIETTRGCPFSCAFCLSGRCGDVRYFDISRVKEEILLLSDSKAKVIKFVDRTFNANRRRSKEIIRFILENYGNKIPKGICFHFEIAGDILDGETIELLRNAPKGSIQLEIGIQSFSEETLAAVNRKTNVTTLKNNILKLTENKNIHIHIDLIAGLPKEGLTSFKNSFNTAFSLNADMLQLGFLKLLHGSAMREDTWEFPCEYSTNAPYEVKSTPWLSERDISVLKYCEGALDKLCNSGRYKRTCDLIFKTGNMDAFETLAAFGRFAGNKSRPWYEFVNCIYEYFSIYIHSDKLRDALLCDCFSFSCAEKIPSLLRVENNDMKCLAKYAGKHYPIEKGTRRKCFILYGQKKGAFVDYTANAPKNEYSIKTVDFKEFLEL